MGPAVPAAPPAVAGQVGQWLWADASFDDFGQEVTPEHFDDPDAFVIKGSWAFVQHRGEWTAA
eukprot:257228-Lingulodinium_polyedra.AAC.1